MFDLNANGAIDLVSVTNGVHFDFWGDGFAEKAGWAAPTDGMLAIDLNANGNIDNGTEMFGSQFPLTFLVADNWDAFINEENGFAKLAKYDLAANGGNGDGAITSLDSVWSSLVMWKDANSDGVSQSGELLTLNSLGITSIDVSSYHLDSFYGLSGGGFARLIQGNTVTHSGTFTMNGVSREVVDVWFDSDLINTVYNNDYTFDARALSLPTVRGYGMIPDLHIAMSLNEDLLDDVSDFVTSYGFDDLFSTNARNDAESIMLKWAGIDPANLPDFDYSKHGVFESMKEYYFLRGFMGQNTDALGTWFDMSPWLPAVQEAQAAILESYHNLLDAFTARLAFQSGGYQLFANSVTYNPIWDEFEGTFALSQSAVNDLETAAGASGDAQSYWRDVAAFIDNTMGIAALSSTELGWLNTAVGDSTSGALDWADITATLTPHEIVGTTGTDTIYGTNYDDVITGDASFVYWNDTGNDTIYGGAGNDHLYGGQNNSAGTNDTLSGGLGDDILEGGWGSDTYIYDYGHDVIVEGSNFTTSNTDILQLAAGINESDVTIHLARLDTLNPHLFLEIAGRGTVTISIPYGLSVPSISLIDEIHFANNAVWTMGTAPVHVHGTDNADVLGANGFTGNNFLNGYGGDDTFDGAGGNDTLDGGGGNDTLNGASGDDIYVVSAGSDIASESSGNDTIFIPQGYTLSDISFLRVEAGGTYDMFDEMKIAVAGLGSMTVMNTFGTGVAGWNVETLKLFDGTQINLLNQVFTAQGTAGDDLIQGTSAAWAQQNDAYLFGTGHDQVSEIGGTDVLKFGAGVLPGSITVSRVTGNNFKNLEFSDGTNSITFLNHFSDAGWATTALESAQFADGTVWTIANMEIDTKGTSGSDTINGYEFGDASNADTIYGYAGNDFLYGNEGADVLYGGDDNDILNGGNGNDILDGGNGNDAIDGGVGSDTVSYASATAGVTVNLTTTTSQNTVGAGTDTITTVENLTGSAFSDTLAGDGNANVIDGGNGDDTIQGGAGNDTLTGGSGTDTVTYAAASAAVTVNLATLTAQNTVGDGTDTISGFENLTGSAFGDTLTGDGNNNVIEGLAGNDTLNGAGGIDTLTYTNAAAGVTVNLATATAQNTVGAGTDTVSNFENLTGSAFGDTLTGDANANVIEGGAGNDTMDGAAGFDTLSYKTATAGITINLSTTTAQNTGGAGTDTISNFEYVIGSAFNDTLTGTTGNNVMEGGAGDDTMNAQGGTDTLSYASATAGITINLATTTAQNTGGAGTDTVSNFENITGSAFNDTLTGTTGNNVIEGGTGNDTMNASSGTDTLLYTNAGGGITVSLAVTTAQNTGGAGTDTISGFENLTGSAFDDVLTGDSNANTIDGGVGNDIIEGGAGDDILTGNAGNDTVSYANAASAVTVNLATTTAQNTVGAGTDTITGFEFLRGSAFNDTLTGASNNNTIEGGAGNDTIDGAGGTDTLSYANAASAVTVSLAVAAAQNTVGAGTDTISNFENLTGSGFDDLLTGDANANVISGGNGNDTIEGGAGNDTLSGNAGSDTASYATAASAVTVNLATTTGQNTVGAGTDTLAGFENLKGSAFNDTLSGDSGNNVITGGAGGDAINGGAGTDTADYTASTAGVNIDLLNSTHSGGDAAGDTLTSIENVTGSNNAGSTLRDTIYGDANANTLYGLNGDDLLEGGGAADYIDGGAGWDTVRYTRSASAVTINLETNVNTGGDAQGDTLYNVEAIYASPYNDTLTGGSGNDTLNGASGNDIVHGGAGNDAVKGEAGNDVLYGEAGTDTLTGGTGADTFMFESASAFSNQDTIADFSAAQGDKFDVHNIIDPIFDPVQNAINNFVNFTNSGSDSIMQIDRDGLGSTYGFVNVATITGVTNLDEDTLYANGNLLAA